MVRILVKKRLVTEDELAAAFVKTERRAKRSGRATSAFS